MFYGLNKFIKNILPKRLFYRALLIVAIPVILIQLIITIVFFDSLWIKTNKGMTKALVNEIKTFMEVYSNENYDKQDNHYLMSIYIEKNEYMTKDIYITGLSVIDLSTGKNYLHYIISKIDDNQIWIDEIGRYIHFYNPSEILFQFIDVTKKIKSHSVYQTKPQWNVSDTDWLDDIFNLD